MLKLINILFVLLCLSTVPAAGEELDPRLNLQGVQSQLKDAADRQATLARDIAEAAKVQEQVSSQLVALTAKALDQEQAVAEAEQKLLSLTTEKANANLALAQKRDSLSHLLAGLQRLEQNPPPALVVAPYDTLSALRGAMLLGTIVPEFRAQANALRVELKRIEQLDLDLTIARETAFATLAALEDTRAEVASLQAEHKKLLAENLSKISSERQRSKDLIGKATSLKALIAALEIEKAKQLEALAAEEAVAAEAERQRLVALQKPLMVFSKSKGQLRLPVQGHILRKFGDEMSDGRRLTGQLLAASKGGYVVSPVDGKVEFAGPFLSYDQLVIINAGEGYLVLLAGMAEMNVSQGETVRAGSPIGVMGDKPAQLPPGDPIAEHTGPMLYVEFRRKQESIDPAPWWLGFRKEAKR